MAHKKHIIDAQTGDEEIVDLTSEEETQLEKDIEESAAEYQAKIDGITNRENLKTSAKTKLMAGEPLTEEEANVMIGG
jgi:hypothetical protein